MLVLGNTWVYKSLESRNLIATENLKNTKFRLS